VVDVTTKLADWLSKDGLLSRPKERVCRLAIHEATAEVVRHSAATLPTAAVSQRLSE